MKKKLNNNLILIETETGCGKTRYYFTSANRGAAFCGWKSGTALTYKIFKGDKFTLPNGETALAYLVDGSDVKYKDINNN